MALPPSDLEQAPHERSHLLPKHDNPLNGLQHEEDAQSIISSHVSKDEAALSATPIGERLPYNDYTTIDWLHDLVSPLMWYISRHHTLR